MKFAKSEVELHHPNLLLVGFVKCGTTSLAKYLTDHPQIATPIAKELYYLVDRDSGLDSMQPIINKLTFGEDKSVKDFDFIELFQNIDGCSYAVDATPFYYSQKTALEYAKNRSDVKILFIVRNPVQRLYSSFQYFQNVFQEYPKCSFTEFVDALLGNDRERADFRQRIRKPFFRRLFDDELEMGNYEFHISKWVEAIGRERVYICKLENLNSEPVAEMIRLCQFLQLPSDFYETYEFQAFMQSYRVRIPALQAIARKLGKEDPIRYDRMRNYQSPFHRIPFKPLRDSLDDLYGAIQRQKAPATVSQSDQARISQYYQKPNANLRDKYQIDYCR